VLSFFEEEPRELVPADFFEPSEGTVIGVTALVYGLKLLDGLRLELLDRAGVIVEKERNQTAETIVDCGSRDGKSLTTRGPPKRTGRQTKQFMTEADSDRKLKS